jgi:hypothetical protein
MVFSLRVSRCLHSMYFARTMPAGHSWPPQPCAKSSWSRRGGTRSPSKSMVEVTAAFMTGNCTKSSLIWKNLTCSTLSAILSPIYGLDKRFRQNLVLVENNQWDRTLTAGHVRTSRARGPRGQGSGQWARPSVKGLLQTTRSHYGKLTTKLHLHLLG